MTRQNIIGDRVRKARAALGLTQDNLAGACQRLGWDISRVTLAKIETGVRAVNDGEVVILAEALKCPPGSLLEKLRAQDAIDVVRQGLSEK